MTGASGRTGFELLERDGLARIGRLATPHGPIETPALLPVVHPDPARQTIPPEAMRRRFGLGAVITSAYIAWRTPELKSRAEAEGIHGLLAFDGPVMTDSGAFQQHAYGSVEVTPEEIGGFQRRIGSDIATVLDRFVEPDAPRAVAEEGVRETLARARAARPLRAGLLAVPVQGGLFPDLRAESAAGASEVGDVLAVGGVVPLLEQYRFADLARLLAACRPSLAPERAVHLFGTGHPISFAFAALFGVDLFDSSAYHKFARRGRVLLPTGTIAIDRVREPICRCALCAELPLRDVARLPAPERERRLAEHNLLACAAEVAEVRQAIRDGTLWELAERRASGHPGLLAGLRAVVRSARVFLPTEPESRPGFRVAGATSGLRPGVIRFLARVARWKEGRPDAEAIAPCPMVPSVLRRLPTDTPAGGERAFDAVTPFGAIPLELTELYPLGGYVGPEEFSGDPAPVDRAPLESVDDAEAARRLDVWTHRHVRGLFAWLYGRAEGEAVARLPWNPERSRRTGRLRALRDDGRPAFLISPDGLPRPTFLGARRLRETLPFPRARIVVDADAAPFVAEGRSLFSRFVAGGDSGLLPGSSALLVDADDTLLAVGRLLLAPPEMGRMERGIAVHVSAHARRPVPPVEEADEGTTDASDGGL